MSALITAICVSAAVNYYASEKASKRASKSQQEGEEKRRLAAMSAEERATLALKPWADSGAEAQKEYVNMVKAGPGKFVPEKQPGYKFGYKEFVEKPLLRAGSLRGGRGTGRPLNELTRKAEDYADLTYDNFLNRYYNSLEPWKDLSNKGLVAADKSGNIIMDTGRTVGESYATTGDIKAQEAINTGTNQQNLANNLLSAYMLSQGGGRANVTQSSYQRQRRSEYDNYYRNNPGELY